MRILLDNCVPKPVTAFFLDDGNPHIVRRAAQEGWARAENGDLIALAATKFDLMVTVDKGIRHEHNLAMLPLPIIEFNAAKNDMRNLLPLRPFMQEALAATRTHLFVAVHRDGRIERVVPRA